MVGIQKALSRSVPNRILKLEARLQGELEEILKQEELVWFQQWREDWIVSGDLNTKFYHMFLVAKKNRLHVSMLQDSNGNWMQDPKVLKIMVQDFS